MLKNNRFLRAAAFGCLVGATYLILLPPKELPPSKENPQTIVSSINLRIEDALFQEENIPLLEEIIAEDIAFLQTPESDQSLGPLTEQEVVDYFTAEIQPSLEEFLHVNEYVVPHVDFGLDKAFFNIIEKPGGLVMLGAFGLLTLGCFGMASRFGREAYLGFTRKKERKPSGFVPLLFAGTSGLMGAYLGLSGYNLMVSQANSFSAEGNRINLSYTAQFEEPESLAMVFGHEFTHSLQWQHGVLPSSYVCEGHANGVEQHLRHEAYERTGNTAFIYEPGQLRLGELLRTYAEICEQFGIEPKPVAESIPAYENDTAHSRGTALFAIRERQWGTDIYPALLEGDYCRIFYSPREKACENHERSTLPDDED